MFHYTTETKKSVEEAVSALEQSLQGYKFGVLWQLDIPAKLAEKGVEFATPYRILEVCNPVEAKRVLEQDKRVGYFLPCKITVYQDGDTTKIGMPKPTVLMELVEDPALKEIAENIEQKLVQAIEEAK